MAPSDLHFELSSFVLPENFTAAAMSWKQPGVLAELLPPYVTAAFGA